MAHAIQYIRSVIFIVVMYAWMAVVGLVGLPFAAVSRDWAFRFVKFYCHSVVWLLKVLCRIRIEVRGTPPEGEVLVVSKHQTFLDVILHLMLLPRGNFIMKRELLYTPFVGFYAKRLGVASVRRGDRAKAMKKMVADVEAGSKIYGPTQLIIYPQGTRVPPGTYKPYKVGAGVLYEKFGKPCIPAATNAGVFWPKRGLYRKPGTVVVHYMAALPAGMKLKQFMREMEDVIETESNALMREAGFEPEPGA